MHKVSAALFLSWFEHSFPAASAGECAESNFETDTFGERPPRFITLDGVRLGFATVAFFRTDHGDTVTLAHIEAQPTGVGRGARMLHCLCAKADELGVFIELQAEPSGSNAMPRADLITLYMRLGFEPGATRNRNTPVRKYMLRRPRPSSGVSVDTEAPAAD